MERCWLLLRSLARLACIGAMATGRTAGQRDKPWRRSATIIRSCATTPCGGGHAPNEQAANACGTACNEAFHKELGAWGGQRVVRQTRGLRGSKLNVILFLKLSTSILRRFHTAATAQGSVASIVAAQLASGRDITLLDLDDDEHRQRQGQGRAAIDREHGYQHQEKAMRTRLAILRGVTFVYPRRGDGRAVRRAAARARGFSNGVPRPRKHTSAAKKNQPSGGGRSDKGRCSRGNHGYLSGTAFVPSW